MSRRTVNEITDGDASVAFLDGAARQSFENPKSVGDVSDKLEAGKRGDCVL